MDDEARIEVDESLLETPLGRKEFILRAAGLTAAVAVGSGALLEEAEAAVKAAVGKLDNSPLGRAQAAALKASTSGNSPARIAVDAAKKLKGVTLNHTYEAGLQSLDPQNYSGPVWEQLTGIKLNTIQLDHASQFSKVIAEHIARSGAFDIVDIEPAWIPSMADGGVIAPIDDFIKKFKAESSLSDLHPLYQTLGTWKGKRYGFFDDGDMFALYYRKDIFADPKLQQAHKAKFKRPLSVPQTWDEYAETAQFITDQLAPKVYGTGAFRKLNGPGNHWSFYQEFAANGGQLFDTKTMKATINSPAGVKTLQQMLAQNKASIKGVEQMDAVSEWTAWLQGKLAFIFSWPPTGRISENYAQSRSKAFTFIPKSSIVGKVGYALLPTGHGEMASGYVKAITSDSKNPEAAYLFVQWATSPEVSTARVMLPFALRDPYRISHYTSPLYRSLWPAAKDYLINLANAANEGVLNPILPGTADFAVALDRHATAVWAGADPKKELDKAAAEWDGITKNLGVDKQRVAYLQFLKLPGSTAQNTISAAGKAVQLS